VTPTPAELTRDQKRVLQTVYEAFRQTGTWPTFGLVDRQLDRKFGIDTERVIKALPSSLIRPLGMVGSAGADVPLKLGIQGVARCAGSDEDFTLFFRALRWMAKRERGFEPALDAPTTELTLTSQDLARAFKLPQQIAVRRLGMLLQNEQWGWKTGGFSDPTTNSWSFTVTRDVRRFRTVKTLADYLKSRERWEERLPSAHANTDPAPSVG
jgi:hypothetical protein